MCAICKNFKKISLNIKTHRLCEEKSTIKTKTLLQETFKTLKNEKILITTITFLSIFSSALAAKEEYLIQIKEHKFVPEILEIPKKKSLF